jgi:hypothetical protein
MVVNFDFFRDTAYIANTCAIRIFTLNFVFHKTVVSRLYI